MGERCGIWIDALVYCMQHHGGQQGGRTCGIFRLVTVYSSMAEGASSADIPCVSNIPIPGYYIPHSFTTSDTADGLRAWRSIGHTVYNRTPQYTAAHNEHGATRHHQGFATPGCVYRVRARACVYYYIIIIL